MNYKEKCYLRKTPEYQKITRKFALCKEGLLETKLSLKETWKYYQTDLLEAEAYLDSSQTSTTEPLFKNS